MIHGIYIKNKPKAKWHLFSVAISAEAANYDINEAIKKIKGEGLDQAEVACQLFESAFWIPETLTEIKNHKPLYN